MKATKDLMNCTFGRLTVIGKDIPDKNGQTRWVCKCTCGKVKTVYAQSLLSGSTTSCNCLQREKNSKRCKTHGVSRTPIYKVYKSMEDRCYNQNHASFVHYGARGITICDEWRNNVTEFVNWSKENGYRKEYQIDRIDNNGNYEPGNCRWTTRKENSNNKRSNRILSYNGETLTMRQFSTKYGINYSTLQNRVYKNWPFEKLIKKVKHEH